MIGDKDNPIVAALSIYSFGSVMVNREAAQNAGLMDGASCVVITRELWDKVILEIQELRDLDHEMKVAENTPTMPDAERAFDRMFIRMSLERSPHILEDCLSQAYEPFDPEAGSNVGTVPPGSQEINDKWWKPKWGTLSLHVFIDALKGKNK